MKLFLVEDDEIIANGLIYSLSSEGFEVVHSASVQSAKQTLDTTSFDLAILDVTLPDGSGYDICQLIKSQREDTPVIFLTARDDEVNVVMGLDMGADDYVTKPFRVRELISRIKSVLRRANKTTPVKTIFQFGDIRIHTQKATVYKGEQEVMLTSLEYRLLLTFAMNEGQVLTRNQLLEGIWDVSGNFINDNTLTVYIKRLREKLEENPHEPKLIQTVRGLGYRAGDGRA